MDELKERPRESRLVEVGKDSKNRTFNLVIVGEHTTPSRESGEGDDASVWSTDWVSKPVADARVLEFRVGLSDLTLGPKSELRSRIFNTASELLRELQEKRTTSDDKRPIAFLCRGIGGLIVKKSLSLASRNPQYFDIAFRTMKLVLTHQHPVVLDNAQPRQPDQCCAPALPIDATPDLKAQAAAIDAGFQQCSCRNTVLQITDPREQDAPGGQAEDADPSDTTYDYQELLYTEAPFVPDDDELQVLRILYAHSTVHYASREKRLRNELALSPIQHSFIKWLDEPAPESATFYLSGPPGSGKTSHFNLFLQEIYRRNGNTTAVTEYNPPIILSFSHDDALDDHRVGSLGQMLVATLFQIVAQRPRFIDRISGFYFSDEELAMHPKVPNIAETEFVSMLQAVTGEPFPDELILTVDGHDECDSRLAVLRTFIETLIQCIKRSHVRLRILLTGTDPTPRISIGIPDTTAFPSSEDAIPLTPETGNGNASVSLESTSYKAADPAEERETTAGTPMIKQNGIVNTSTDVPFAKDEGRVAFLQAAADELGASRPGFRLFIKQIKAHIQQQNLSFLETRIVMHGLRHDHSRSLPKRMRDLHIPDKNKRGAAAWLYGDIWDELQSGQNKWISGGYQRLAFGG
ncbi:hypothetical protein QBC47DRAFT_84522 [Echria macrotheca]|uniref:Nephrocystin 3-like N-terminal domain-containing protein n=1 Tax=Echria macrotheca TaxID=438768 RepID=A0AAJ0B3P8_9PEZI|nr:hypothetical protein QBC47DRAFT_84522 [Echria macrotheca]